MQDGSLGKVYWAFSTNAGGGQEQETSRAGGDVLQRRPHLGGLEITGPLAPEVLGVRLPKITVLSAGPSQLEHVKGSHTSIGEAHVYNDIMHLEDCVQTGRPPVPTGEHARHVVEIIEKAYEAARTGQAQTLTSMFTPVV